MKIILALKEGAQFVVNLSVDLKTYCEAYAVFSQCKKDLGQLLSKREVGDRLVSDDDIRTATNKCTDTKNEFSKLRSELEEYLSAFYGQWLWKESQKLLKSQCISDNPLTKALLSVLSITDQKLSPLGIESLDENFVELLKNSIDAILINYLKSSVVIVLQMEISISVVGSTIAITIRDNAGGFSESDLVHFSSPAWLEGHKIEPLNRCHKLVFSDYCFGGFGRGLARLAHYLRGNLLVSGHECRSYYAVEKGSTSLSIGNSAVTGGAEITVKTPLEPFSLIMMPPAPEVRRSPSPDENKFSFFSAPDAPVVALGKVPLRRLRIIASPFDDVIDDAIGVGDDLKVNCA